MRKRRWDNRGFVIDGTEDRVFCGPALYRIVSSGAVAPFLNDDAGRDVAARQGPIPQVICHVSMAMKVPKLQPWGC